MATTENVVSASVEPLEKRAKIEKECVVPTEETTFLNPTPTDVEITAIIPDCSNSSTTPLSKRQQKKLIKLAQWEDKKKQKRIKEREKYKRKRQEAIELGLPTRTGPSRKELKRNKVEESTTSLRVAVDLDFDDLMIDKDVAKCVKQLLRIYTINRRSSTPAKLFFTGIKDQGRIHKSLEKNDGYENWDVQWHFKPYTDVLDKDKVVYLTSDSDSVLEELKADEIYIIGGIVDHNHQKGLCHERAQKLGIKTARLPLNEHVDMKTRTVLTTYHVFEILLRLSEGKVWTDAILQTIPMRKGAKAKLNDLNSEAINTDKKSGADLAKCEETILKNAVEAITGISEKNNEHNIVAESLIDSAS